MMTKSPTPANPRPSRAVERAGVERWAAPATDQTFTFTGNINECPAWVDRNWAGYDRGPALQLPSGDIYGKAPYTTIVARIGDKVVFTAAKGASPAKFTVIPGELDPNVGDGGTLKPPQVSNASLEDMLKTGNMSPGDLGTDAAAQVAQRSPELQKMIEDGHFD